MFFNVYNANEMYEVLLKSLKKNGVNVSPRGFKCKELLGISVRINNPRDRIITEVNRKFPIKGATAEFLWYMTQNNKVSIITPYLKHWARYSDDGITVNSNYGYRWGNQVENVIQKIKNDPQTRQGVVTLYDESFSTYYGKDNVCTPDFQFLLRDGMLHLIVNARSRDLIRGECIDQFTFSYLQETVANSLGVDVGFYQVNIANLHIYEEHFNLFDSEVSFNKNLKAEISPEFLTKIEYLQFWENVVQYNQTEAKEVDSLLCLINKTNIHIDHFLGARNDVK